MKPVLTTKDEIKLTEIAAERLLNYNEVREAIDEVAALVKLEAKDVIDRLELAIKEARDLIDNLKSITDAENQE